jgi:hypothetical protein
VKGTGEAHAKCLLAVLHRPCRLCPLGNQAPQSVLASQAGQPDHLCPKQHSLVINAPTVGHQVKLKRIGKKEKQLYMTKKMFSNARGERKQRKLSTKSATSVNILMKKCSGCVSVCKFAYVNLLVLRNHQVCLWCPKNSSSIRFITRQRV